MIDKKMNKSTRNSNVCNHVKKVMKSAKKEKVKKYCH